LDVLITMLSGDRYNDKLFELFEESPKIYMLLTVVERK